MKELNYIDLFSGIGGFAKGFEDAGIKFKNHWFSEIDKHAIANYLYNFKNAKYAGDINTISGTEFGKKQIDIITFGFPCQDLSIAGNRKGITGKRSSLFFQAIRLIKALKPTIFIFENVEGLLSSNEQKDFETVLQTIANIGLYDCEWQLLNTVWILPQNRERIFFIGHLRTRPTPFVFPFREVDEIFAKKCATRNIGETRPLPCLTGSDHKGASKQRIGLVVKHDVESTNFQGKEILNTFRAGGTGTLSDKHNFDVIIQKPRCKNKGGEHEICPTLISNSFEQNNIIKCVNPDKSQSQRIYKEEGLCCTLSGASKKSGDCRPIIQINPSQESGKKQPYQQNRVYDAKGIVPALNAELNGRVNISVTDKDKIKPVRWKRTEKGKQARKEAKNNGKDYTPFGDGNRELIEADENSIGCITGAINKDSLLSHDRILRRLTEIEAERIQGFPDNWTMYGIYDGNVKKIAKTNRYKMLGNAITSTWAYIIAKRLFDI